MQKRADAKAQRKNTKPLQTIHDPERRRDWKKVFGEHIILSGGTQEYVDSPLNILDWFMVLPPKQDLEYEHDINEFQEDLKMRHVNFFERMGRRAGKEEGLQEGLQKGLKQLRSTVVLILHERFGRVPRKMRTELREIDDFDAMSGLLKSAIKTQSLQAMSPIILKSKTKE